jgi:hypothetical protein
MRFLPGVIRRIKIAYTTTWAIVLFSFSDQSLLKLIAAFKAHDQSCEKGQGSAV